MKSLKKLAFALTLALVYSMAWSPVADAKFVSPYNHPDLEWYTIETEHFAVHYPVSKKGALEGNEHYLTTEYSAKRTAQFAEEMWPKMCAQFNYYLKERVDIVILNQSDDLEGFTIPAWDWIEISANPGTYFYRMRGRMEWFSAVLIHEFAHVVSLKANANFAEGASGVYVGGLYQNGINDTSSGATMYVTDGEPWWWVEGGAEYWSEATGYYWWTSNRDMNIRMTVLEDRLLSYTEWLTRIGKSDWGDGERGYQQGYSIALYIREMYGDDKFAQFAKEYGNGYQINWSKVIEEVLGIDSESLYNNWVEYITNKYQLVHDEIKAEGEVVGHNMMMSAGEWEFNDPSGRDKWFDQLQRDREDKIEATGTWALEPRYSDDGRWFGHNNRGRISVSETPEDMWYAFSGVWPRDSERRERRSHMSHGFRTAFMAGWDFVPGQDAFVMTGKEHNFHPSKVQSALGIRPEWDGYNWNQLWFVPLVEREEEKKGRTYTTIKPENWNKKTGRYYRGNAFAIPNTYRGVEPAVSPDGERIAYFEYTDGTLNLVTINLDGSEKTHLTNYKDGTWMQKVDWSPDGSQLVFAIYRNFQEDIFIINADGSDLHPITWDGHEELDTHWAQDGKIYFSADPEGIFNIYSYDPETYEVLQITNVIGGAQCPWITPEGNLTYSYYTGHGWKTFGLSKDEFMNEPVTSGFNFHPPEEVWKPALAYSEDLSDLKPVKYRPTKAVMPPTATPLMLFNNDSLSSWGMQAGFQVLLQDFAEQHSVSVMALAGQNMDALIAYRYQKWHPTFFVFGRVLSYKSNFAYALDEDGDYETDDDRTFYEARNNQAYGIFAAGMDYQISGALNASLTAFGVSTWFRGNSDPDFVPFSTKMSTTLNLNYDNSGGWYRSAANPRGVKNIDFRMTHGYTNVLYKAFAGVNVDDGEKLGQYHYNSLEFRYTNHLPVPDLFNRLLEKPERDPTLQIDFQAGAVDRNVLVNDEFRAGGRHPFFWGSGSVTPNTFFAGYPPYSLGGETLLILSMAYRFPIATKIHKQLGPFYIYGVYGQLMGTTGNLWSYRYPQEEGSYYTNRYDERIAYDPSTIRREIPFVDYAYKNSPVDDPNYLLFDAGAEIRINAAFAGRSYFNSFIRVARGFNEIRGFSDVNGDNVFDTSDSALGDALSNETEPAKVRVYIGLGTGW